MSLGGTTGYAINPARDLGPRIIHQILPIPGKGQSDWGYSWIPVVGPLVGGVIAGGSVARRQAALRSRRRSVPSRTDLPPARAPDLPPVTGGGPFHAIGESA